jgi:4-methyl-5(b-hydroxyethyl)-thiazole monophosphate biosynthesis
MKKTALVVLTHGFEEIEAITPIDLLRRAETEVTLASAADTLEITGKMGVILQADVLLDDCLGKKYDLLVLPGGPGVFSLREDARVLDLIAKQVQEGCPVGAICAAPVLLKDAGVLNGKSHTAHGAVAEELPEMKEGLAVVEDFPLITSRGPGTALAFGLALVRVLQGEEVARKVAEETHAD